MQAMWNPWYGCKKYSDGCRHCYISRGAERKNIDFNNVHKSEHFDLPLKRKKDGLYHYKSGTFFNLCFSSDFLIEDADSWRDEVWNIIRERNDCTFLFLTKRIDRLEKVLPSFWNEIKNNVHVGCTCETQQLINYRIPIFKKLDIPTKHIVLGPLLEEVDIEHYLDDSISGVTTGGESVGEQARILDFNWILKVRQACVKKNVNFDFRQTGSRLLKDGTIYKINYFKEHVQAKLANVNYKKRLDADL